VSETPAELFNRARRMLRRRIAFLAKFRGLSYGFRKIGAVLAGMSFFIFFV